MLANDAPPSALTCVALHPDGCRAVSGNAAGQLRVWDPRTSRCLLAIDAHTGRVSAAIIDPAAGRVLSTSWDKCLKVWDMESGQCLDTQWGHSRVVAIAERPRHGSGYGVASRSFDYRSLRIWSFAGEEREITLAHPPAGFLSFAFLPDGERAISGGWDGEVTLWDLATGKRLDARRSHRAAITAVAIQGDSVLTGDAEGGLGVWNLESGTVQLIPDAHQGRVLCLSATGDEHLLAISGGADKRVRGWDLKTCARLSEWTAVTAVSASALGRSASLSIDQGYRLPAMGSSKTLVAIGDEAGNLSFFEWSPYARPEP